MAKTKENVVKGIVVHWNTFQSLAIGLEISRFKVETVGFVSSTVSAISPNGTITLVVEPGKFVSNLNFLVEGGARRNLQWATFGERKAFTLDLDVTYNQNEI
jgi:hypothetical protein